MGSRTPRRMLSMIPSTMRSAKLVRDRMRSRAEFMFIRARRTTDAMTSASRSREVAVDGSRRYMFAARATSAIVVLVMPNRSKQASAAARMLAVTSGTVGSVGFVTWKDYSQVPDLRH